MGGLFSAPSPPSPPPPKPIPDPGIEEEKRRREMIERKRRGHRGTITTSPRGLLALNDVTSSRRSLLGE